MVLHNLCVTTWQDVLSAAELQQVLGEEQMDRKRTLTHAERTGESRTATHRRRDRLVDEMLEYDPDSDVVEDTIS